MDQAGRYSSIKYALAISEWVFSLVVISVFLLSGFSIKLAGIIKGLLGEGSFLVIPVFIFCAFFLYAAVSFPLTFTGSFVLEHRFELSRQSLSDWIKDQLKGAVISYIIGLILAGAFYYILARFPSYWWVSISLVWIIFSIVFAKLLPVVIIPLFFKYKPLADEGLKNRIISLAERMRVRIIGVFEIDFSKKSLKANAAFVGVGNTRRVILADTLKDRYSPDEIEVILAHEFAHYRLGHLSKMIIINSLTVLFLFYFMDYSHRWILAFLGLHSLADIEALPLVLFYFVLFAFLTTPIENYLSRKFERAADRIALQVTNNSGAFISMMDKLGRQNLADRNPHPLIKFFFFSHPSVEERMQMAKQYGDKRTK